MQHFFIIILLEINSLFAAPTTASPTQGPSVVRSSAFGDLSPFVSGEHSTTGSTHAHISAKVAKQLDAVPSQDSNSQFQFNFNCEGTSTQLCDYAKAGFLSAGAKISNVLKINTPIIVDAKFHSFCLSQGGGACTQANNTLGRASSAAYFSAYDINRNSSTASSPIYYYPQSLVKQLHTSESLNFASIDIYAEFNSDFNFYFKASGQPSVGVNQTDFEFVVAHELTHGLGFDSAWVQYSNFYTAFSISSDILSPLPFAQGATYASSTITSMSPLNIFDSLLTATNSGNTMASYGAVIENYAVEGQSLSDFIGKLGSDASLTTAAKSAMSAAKSGLQLRPVSGTPLTLNTPSSFAQGTSIVHVNAKSSNTPDFLMIPAMSPLLGKSLDAIMQTNNAAFIYGPGITAAMSAMGWPTKDDPTVKPLQMVRISSAVSLRVTVWLVVAFQAFHLF